MSKLYHRYSKVVRNAELPSWFKISKAENVLASSESCGEKTFEFYQKLRTSLTINVPGSKYPILIYPLRVAEVYVYSRQGKSKLFDSNIKLYKYLLKVGAIHQSEELQQEFKLYKMLDFDKLASLIPGATATHQPLYQYQVDEDDIMVKKFSPKGKKIQVWAVPCLFEDLVYFEAFVSRDFIDKNFKSRVKKEKLVELKDEAFFTPSEVYTEFAERASKEYQF